MIVVPPTHSVKGFKVAAPVNTLDHLEKIWTTLTTLTTHLTTGQCGTTNPFLLLLSNEEEMLGSTLMKNFLVDIDSFPKNLVDEFVNTLLTTTCKGVVIVDKVKIVMII